MGTFTWSRTKYVDKVASPKLYGNFLPQPTTDPDNRYGVQKGEFFAVQGALGNTPGWQVVFGGQDPIPDALTKRYVNPDPSDPDNNPPVVTMLDLSASLSMNCAAAAPARRLANFATSNGPDLNSFFIGLVRTIQQSFAQDHAVLDAAYTVELIQPGIAAIANAPAVLPVYRVTLPAAAAALNAQGSAGEGMIISYNGQAQQIYGQYFALRSLGQFGVVHWRSPTCVDVQMRNAGDTLSAGTVSYYKLALPASGDAEATIQASGYTDNATIDLRPAFRFSGQSSGQNGDDFDTSGTRFTVQF